MAGMNQDYLDAIKGKGKLVGGNCPAAPAPQVEGRYCCKEEFCGLGTGHKGPCLPVGVCDSHDAAQWDAQLHAKEEMCVNWRVGAAPAETARPWQGQRCCKNGMFNQSHECEKQRGETAGEMTRPVACYCDGVPHLQMHSTDTPGCVNNPATRSAEIAKLAELRERLEKQWLAQDKISDFRNWLVWRIGQLENEKQC